MLDKAPIFNHLDSFIQRCKDMIEVCEAMITFGRFDETEDIPKPRFGGSRGEEFEKWCQKIEDMFGESLDDIEKVFNCDTSIHKVFIKKSRSQYE